MSRSRTGHRCAGRPDGGLAIHQGDRGDKARHRRDRARTAYACETRGPPSTMRRSPRKPRTRRKKDALAQRDRAVRAEEAAKNEQERSRVQRRTSVGQSARDAVAQSRFLAGSAHQARTEVMPGARPCLRLRRCRRCGRKIWPYVPRRNCSSTAPGVTCASGLILASTILCMERRSAPTASASSPRLRTRPRASGTPRPASRSASRSRAMRIRSIPRRSAPTASASSPRHGTRPRASGTP